MATKSKSKTKAKSKNLQEYHPIAPEERFLKPEWFTTDTEGRRGGANWHFDTSSVQWTDADTRTYPGNRKMVSLGDLSGGAGEGSPGPWQTLEAYGCWYNLVPETAVVKSSGRVMKIDLLSEVASTLVDKTLNNQGWKVPCGNRKWVNRYPAGDPPQEMVSSASTTGRLSSWGVRDFTQNTDKTGVYSAPMKLTFKKDDEWYTIPNLWIQLDHGGYGRVASNWKNYDLFDWRSPNQSISVYGFKRDEYSKPYVFTMKTTPYTDPYGSTIPITSITVDNPISFDPSVPYAFIDEFNFKMAEYRRNLARREGFPPPYGTRPMKDSWQTYLQQDGSYGWYGKSDFLMKKLISNADGYNIGKEPNLWLDYAPIGGIAKGMYISDQGSCKAEAEYVQTFTVINDTDSQQTMRTSDYSHAIAESDAHTEGTSDQVATKASVTVKWETALGINSLWFDSEVKFSTQIAIEAGYTRTWSRQDTHTTTDTKTYTMGGQTVSVPPKSAVQVEVSFFKVTANFTVGNAVQVSDFPAAYFAVGTDPAYKCQIDWNTARNYLYVKSIKDGWKDEKNVNHPGNFIMPTSRYRVVRGAAGSARVTPTTYVPPKGEAANQLTVITEKPK